MFLAYRKVLRIVQRIWLSYLFLNIYCAYFTIYINIYLYLYRHVLYVWGSSFCLGCTYHTCLPFNTFLLKINVCFWCKQVWLSKSRNLTLMIILLFNPDSNFYQISPTVFLWQPFFSCRLILGSCIATSYMS